MTSHRETTPLTIAHRIADRVQTTEVRNGIFIVGICGPQGSGKSTITAILKQLLEKRGLAVAALCLDDFYHPRETREALACSLHPLLKTRGVPGTHDIALALKTVAALRQKGTVPLPSFDKAFDDRRPQSEWPQVRAPVDVILFEGWCVGARPLAIDLLNTPINELEAREDPQGTWRHHVNSALAGDYQSLFCQIDYLILLAAPSFDIVYRWRLEQENELRRKVAGAGGDRSRLMSDEELNKFISHYERLTRHILEEMPGRAELVVRLDENRRMTVV